MAPATRLCLLLPLRPVASAAASRGGARVAAAAAAAARAIHSNPAQPAKVVPVYGTGPPPEPPQPSAEFAAEERDERLARRKRQAEMLRQAGDIKALRQQQKQEQESGTTKPVGLKRRFWKDVDVKEVNGALEIHLDARPLRHPTTKSIIRLPLTKPHLAHALALEWDSLTSAAQATKQHLIPLTSLTCRALDIASDDTSGGGSIRASITTTLLRYLDTDSLLCFAPAPTPATHGHDLSSDDSSTPTLHTLQHQAYTDTTSYLTTHAWPGVTIVPVLDSNSIMPRHQAPGTREVVQGWILSLSPFELAGLERATLGGKSLLAAARLVVEWSEEGAHSHSAAAAGQTGKRFGVEEAARAVSLEVEWQTRQWGEVEDTHDVEKEDVRRQFGSVVLLVSGSGTGAKKRD
ncbi:protein atp12, mitochondrial [Parachaetomium inaequale]|uniref:Protein atp12, mitochondrial n=1 Tax=Parachaetomium inaequale TaxID=2588326 RepID=A0AAN6STW6_9PEZI|nr:protein atp12, mitochondrial [Parachaetomium inaequale]